MKNDCRAFELSDDDLEKVVGGLRHKGVFDAEGTELRTDGLCGQSVLVGTDSQRCTVRDASGACGSCKFNK